jgi:hypothetical protein
MAIAALRAEVVAQDDFVAGRLREYLEELSYEVAVRRTPAPAKLESVDLVLYHVPRHKLMLERRATVRPDSIAPSKKSRFWLETLWSMRQSAPEVPIVVVLPPGAEHADNAIDSGATDVMDDTVTPKMFRRRMEMLHAFQNAPGGVVYLRRAPRAAPQADVQAPVLELPLPELRHRRSGRINAQSVADYLGVPLKKLANAVGVGYAGIHKTPDSPRVQVKLRPVVRVLELANRAFGNAEQVRKWLNRPLHELEDESPLAVILAGEADAVETLLVNALTGVPV